MERERGVVKWFSAVKGYGFVGRPNKPDLFLHFSSLQMDGYKQVKEGDKVEFSVVQGDKGAQAAEVRVVS